MNFNNFGSQNLGSYNPDIYDANQFSGQIDMGPVYGENLEFGGLRSISPEPTPVFQPQQQMGMSIDQMQYGFNEMRPYY